jgi:hypothetical protein
VILLVSGATKTVDAHPEVGRLISPRSGNSMATVVASGRPWAADNDAFAAWNTERYWLMLSRIAAADRSRLLWVTVPDVVADARETLNRWCEWQPQLDYLGLPAAFVGQDGVEHMAEEIPWEDMAAWFIGGSTAWKLSAASDALAIEAKARGKWLHMGRVNSQRRMRHALEIGCDSIDGGQFSMFPDTKIPGALRWIKRAKQQPVLF